MRVYPGRRRDGKRRYVRDRRQTAVCAKKCVKEKGAKWALYNTTDKSLFVLSGDDAMAEKMAGKRVTVKGSMSKEKKEINVATMEQAP